MKINRRQSRETAFTLVFEWSFHNEPFESLIKNAVDGRSLEEDEFAARLCETTLKNSAMLDSLIESYSETWKLTRISKVTLAVLRIAFCEITLMDDIPLGATINEAVELCKKFATEDEAAYVNGILGQYGRDRETGRHPGAPDAPGKADNL